MGSPSIEMPSIVISNSPSISDVKKSSLSSPLDVQYGDSKVVNVHNEEYDQLIFAELKLKIHLIVFPKTLPHDHLFLASPYPF